MVTVALIAIGAMAFISAFQGINRALQSARMRTIATNLAQEEVEYLKNFSYYTLLVTTSSLTNSNFTPNLPYDNSAYPPQTFSYWGNSLTRAVYIQYATPVNGQMQTLPYTANDPGLKMITVYVWWNDGAGWREVEMQNLLENPNVSTLNSQITGFVYDSSSGNSPLSGAIVSVLGSPQWNTESSLNGSFSLSVAAGSYTVVASSIGFFSASSPLLSAPSGGSVSQNFYLTQMASGTVVANSVYFSSNIVISQIVADTQTVVGDGATQQVQYVELFNPTTFPVLIGSNPLDPNVELNYLSNDGSGINNELNFPLYYVNTTISSGSYYLIANATSFYIAGIMVNADAYYTNPLSLYQDVIATNHAGAVQIAMPSGAIIDGVGWDHNSVSHGAPWYEGSPIPSANGVQQGEQFIRFTSNVGMQMGWGRAYNTFNNQYDFFDLNPMIYSCYNSLTSEPIDGGVPAVGAVVTANDGLSSSTTAYSTGGNWPAAAFALSNVATGTWMVVVASGAYQQSVSSVTISYSGQTIPILNSFTSPVSSFAPVGFLPLSSAALGGYIAGTVTSVQGTPLSGITVLGGASSALTNSSGFYFLSSSTGTAALGTAVSLSVNPNQQNPLYVSATASVNVYSGEVTVQNFTLSQGGEIIGYATSGLSVLPGIVFVASNTETTQAGTTDDTGHFYIPNLTTGTYTVIPQLSSGQTSSPAQASVNVGSGNLEVFSASFTISGIMGTFSGTVSAGGNPVTTGVIIMASTGTLSYPPPNITGSGAGQIYYATMSQPDGSYSLPVRGSNSSTTYTYNLLAIYPSVDEGNGAVSVVSQTQSGSVNAGQTQTVNFTGL